MESRKGENVKKKLTGWIGKDENIQWTADDTFLLCLYRTKGRAQDWAGCNRPPRKVRFTLEEVGERSVRAGPRTEYRKQNGCWNCEHCVRIPHHEEADEYFCGLNAPPRPPSGSFAIPGEAIYDHKKNTWDEMADAEDAWEAWSEPRRVSVAGICDRWRKMKGKNK